MGVPVQLTSGDDEWADRGFAAAIGPSRSPLTSTRAADAPYCAARREPAPRWGCAGCTAPPCPRWAAVGRGRAEPSGRRSRGWPRSPLPPVTSTQRLGDLQPMCVDVPGTTNGRGARAPNPRPQSTTFFQNQSVCGRGLAATSHTPGATGRRGANPAGRRLENGPPPAGNRGCESGSRLSVVVGPLLFNCRNPRNGGECRECRRRDTASQDTDGVQRLLEHKPLVLQQILQAVQVRLGSDSRRAFPTSSCHKVAAVVPVPRASSHSAAIPATWGQAMLVPEMVW